MKTSLYLVSETNQPQTDADDVWEIDAPVRPLDFDKPLSRVQLNKLSSNQRRSMMRVIARSEQEPDFELD
ncbi:MAG: hypothetical protein CMK09_07870 [Ponticaulis sp.]|nr:hypothetical protein [Ponticaulis sp.]|tara:strand:+ start:21665 stop:21874 length:210 start_codon:yes stop_codon:yes gene_type:complete